MSKKPIKAKALLKRGLAKQLVNTAREIVAGKQKPVKGPTSYKGWQQDSGPDPWGQDFDWAQEPPDWNQSSRPDYASTVTVKVTTVRAAMRKAKRSRTR